MGFGCAVHGTLAASRVSNDVMQMQLAAGRLVLQQDWRPCDATRWRTLGVIEHAPDEGARRRWCNDSK